MRGKPVQTPAGACRKGHLSVIVACLRVELQTSRLRRTLSLQSLPRGHCQATVTPPLLGATAVSHCGPHQVREQSMKSRGGIPLLMFALVLCGLLPVVAAGQRIEATNQPQSDSCLSANSVSMVMVHAPKSGAYAAVRRGAGWPGPLERIAGSAAQSRSLQRRSGLCCPRRRRG